jgi:hypothetical protein
MLGKLAQQFGETTGRYGSLRDALGKVNPDTRQWEPTRPDPSELGRVFEPHARGSLLVAAVFDAFLSIYKARIADLLRIASSGSGVLPAGALHPDLVNRLAIEAAKSAQHVCTMCIRALDYCPPVDLTFGEYLRALISADYDLVRDDDKGYRIAFIEAFRRRGIYPPDVRTLSTSSLRWEPPSVFLPPSAIIPPFATDLIESARKWDLFSDRKKTFEQLRKQYREIRQWIPNALTDQETARALGLNLDPVKGKANPANADDPVNKEQSYDVTALRPARRVGPDGQHLTDLIIEITQRRWEPLVPPGEGRKRSAARPLAGGPGGFWFRGGCTLVYDLQRRAVRYCIRKDIDAEARLQLQRDFLMRGSIPSLQATYFGRLERDENGEAFAFLHATGEDEVSA